MFIPSALYLLIVLVGQGPAEDTPAGRLAFMQASLEKIDLRQADDKDVVFKLQLEPVMRFNNPVGTVRDGANFVWLGETGRPVAAVQVFHHKTTGVWHQEFSSLTDRPLTTGAAWGPTPPGVEFRPVPGAPTPADTPEQRMRQMRDLTREFVAEDAGASMKTYEKLRLLTRPFARYGRPGMDPIDGALFAYVLTTDPEVYLLLEARRGKDGLQWHYAFAPATVWPVKGSCQGREVWSLPYREAWNTPRAAFYVGSFARSSPIP